MHKKSTSLEHFPTSKNYLPEILFSTSKKLHILSQLIQIYISQNPKNSSTFIMLALLTHLPFLSSLIPRSSINSFLMRPPESK